MSNLLTRVGRHVIAVFLAGAATFSHAAKDEDWIVKFDPAQEKKYSAAERAAARHQAQDLLDAMRRTEILIPRAEVMGNTFRYFREFNNPLNDRITVWPKLSDDRRNLFDDLNYCQEAALKLMFWGDGINGKKSERYISQNRDAYRATLPKCEQAIKKYK